MDLYKIRSELSKGISINSMPLKVTYYSRVSTEHDEQINSLKNQVNHFDEMIINNKNWTYVEGYVDAGISGKRIEQGLNAYGYKTSEMNGVLITHEHIDHIGGLGVISRKYGLPIYATEKTKRAVLRTKTVGKIDESLFRVITPDETFLADGLEVEPIHISHDAADPVAYIVKSGGKSVGVITDLGMYDDYIVEKLGGLNLLLLEGNGFLSLSFKAEDFREKRPFVQ